MGRTKLSPRIQVTVQVPEELYQEFMLLHPELQDHRGHTKYGGLSSFLNALLRKACDERQTRIREGVSMEPAPTPEKEGDDVRS